MDNFLYSSSSMWTSTIRPLLSNLSEMLKCRKTFKRRGIVVFHMCGTGDKTVDYVWRDHVIALHEMSRHELRNVND
jgi:hypothetical protein